MTPQWEVVVVGGANFAAALAVGPGEQRSPEDAGRFASAATALATTRLGAQASLPRRREVAALLASLSPPTGGPAAAPA
jgi:ribokinase